MINRDQSTFLNMTLSHRKSDGSRCVCVCVSHLFLLVTDDVEKPPETQTLASWTSFLTPLLSSLLLLSSPPATRS